jgi:hypothetical protein
MVFVQRVEILLRKEPNMLQPRLIDCSECNDISLLIDKINCRLAKLGGSLYGNVTLMLNSPISAYPIIGLLNYKRILEHKQVNSDYCEDYTVDEISSRVNILIYR